MSRSAAQTFMALKTRQAQPPRENKIVSPLPTVPNALELIVTDVRVVDKTVALLTKEPGDVKFETDIPATIYAGTVAANCNTVLPADVIALVAKVPVLPESVMGLQVVPPSVV